MSLPTRDIKVMDAMGHTVGVPVAHNCIRNVVPTALFWDVAPTNLERCTDNKWDSVTGIGYRDVAAWGNVGCLTFDLGSKEHIGHVVGKILIGTTHVGSIELFFDVESSEDGVTYIKSLKDEYACRIKVDNTDKTVYFTAFMKGRYLRLFWKNGGEAALIRGAVYQVQIYDYGF